MWRSATFIESLWVDFAALVLTTDGFVNFIDHHRFRFRFR
jgi:hypothetical protein